MIFLIKLLTEKELEDDANNILTALEDGNISDYVESDGENVEIFLYEKEIEKNIKGRSGEDFMDGDACKQNGSEQSTSEVL